MGGEGRITPEGATALIQKQELTDSGADVLRPKAKTTGANRTGVTWSNRPKPFGQIVVEKAGQLPEDTVEELATIRDETIRGGPIVSPQEARDPNAVLTAEDTEEVSIDSKGIAPQSPPTPPETVSTPIASTPESDSSPESVPTSAEIPPVVAKFNGLLTDAVRVLSQKKDASAFADPDKQAKAEQAISFSTRDGQTPENLRSIFDSLSFLQSSVSDQTELAELSRIYDGLSENVTILFEGKLYLLKDLRHESADPKTGVEMQNQIKKVMSEGEYAFDYDPAGSIVYSALEQQAASLDQAISKLQEAGHDTSTQEALLLKLRTALNAKGAARGLFAQAALKAAQEAGAKGLENVMPYAAEVASQSEIQLAAGLVGTGLTEQQAREAIGQINSGDIQGLIKSGVLKREGAEELIFGEKLSQEKMGQMLKAFMTEEQARTFFQKYGKEASLLLLLLSLMGNPFEKLQSSFNG